MGLLDKANRRQHYPVVLDDRTIYVRSLTGGEIRRMKALKDDLKTPFVMGCCLVTDSGVPEVSRLKDETDEDFSKRVDDLLADAEVDTEVMSKISQAIGKIGKVDVDDLKKTLPKTPTPDSPDGSASPSNAGTGGS